MIDYIDDTEAFVLANTYNFCPPRKARPTSENETDYGKYEADCKAGEAERTMTLAQTLDGTNILFKYEPNNLVP